jgi:polysaccharide pyruvyl transferase WcaK-like protein
VSNIVESGDLAYLLKPAPESDVPAADQNFIAGAPGSVIGLNIISKVLGKDGRFNERMQLIANACKALAESDKCRFLLLPHDDHEDSADLARLAQTLLEIGGESWSHLVTPVPRAAMAKRLAGMCTHLFTCRLHLGIAALGMGRPVTGFPYQGKFEGQFELFGLSEEGLISPDRFPTSVEELVALMRARIAQSDALAKQIQSRLPAVQALSRKNFDGLGSVPESAP